MLKSFQDIHQAVARIRRKKTISIAKAENVNVLKAVREVEEKNIARILLVGDPDKIITLARKVHYTPRKDQIVAAKTAEENAIQAVDLVRTGQADILMKGHISTPVLMKAVLDKQKGLRTGEVLSHVAVAEVAAYPKLLALSDGGINIRPALETKASILRNLIKVLHQLKIETPKVALLCPIEKVNPKIEETVDAAELQKQGQEGAFGAAIVEGPIAMDVALSAEAAQRKNLHSRITGQTDAFLVPGLTAGNAIIKMLMQLAAANVGGIVVGAKVPIILLSRSDTSREKLNSIMLSILLSE